jgi:hypothetical protein
VGLTLALGACGSKPKAEVPPAAPADVKPSIAVVGNEDGLEVRWWITQAGGDDLLLNLGPSLADQVPLDVRAREILAANGFRVIAMPVDQVDRLPSQLRPVGSVQQQRLAQSGTWVDVARGPSWTRSTLLTMHDGPVELPPGRLRLLARGWLTPLPASGAGPDAVTSAVSFELVPQHHESVGVLERDVADLTLAEPDTSAPSQGIMFWRLAARGQLRPGEALVIVAEDPYHRWSDGDVDEPVPAETAAPASDAAAAPPSSSIGRVIRTDEPPASTLADEPRPRTSRGVRDGSAPLGPTAGPPALRAPTVGEALLLSRTGPDGPIRARAVVVLVPRTPENFRLLGGR